MKENKPNKQRIGFLPLIVLGIFAVFTLYCILTPLFLHVETYCLDADISSPIRIVQLSDLHNNVFGDNNNRLMTQVAKQNPDLIFICGDMLNKNDPDTDLVTALVRELSTMAPVFYGYGNHEKAWEKRFGENLAPILEEAGATVVDGSYIDLEINGNALRIGGYMGYYQAPLMNTGDPGQQRIDYAFARAFQDTDRLKLLINHIPTQWVDWGYVDKYPVDFVFSGHYHGGLVRIPILDRGLYAPYVGWFPPFSKGVYSGERATCVLSAGLGSEGFILRINNPPEIVVIELIPKS